MRSQESSPLNQDFTDLLRAFTDEKVRFLVVGAYAMAVHGEPRATGDIDLWVEPTVVNGRRVLAALRRFGAPLRDLELDDLTRGDTIYQIGLAPRRIDLMTSATGLRFDTAWKSRVVARFGALQVPVLGRRSLIRNKIATGRPKDLVDLEPLRRSSRRRRRS